MKNIYIICKMVIYTFLCIIANANGVVIKDFSPKGPQPQITKPQGGVVRLYKESHALLISQASYMGLPNGGWDPLEHTEAEMDELAIVLQKHGFHVRRVSNANSEELRLAYRNFIYEFGTTDGEDNRLLLYYSGHGYTQKLTSVGFLVPIDAKNPSIPGNKFFINAVPIREIVELAQEVQSKHIMFVFDSCFSGTAFGIGTKGYPDLPERGEAQTDRWRPLVEKKDLPTRYLITAGGANETLPPNSIFLKQFIRALKYEGVSANRDGYLTGSELGNWLRWNVRNWAPQNPIAGTIGNKPYEGDMVFQLNQEEAGVAKKGDADRDEEEWTAAKNLKTADAITAYLRKYPKGKYADTANALLLNEDPKNVVVKPLPNSSVVKSIAKADVSKNNSTSATSSELEIGKISIPPEPAAKKFLESYFWVYIGDSIDNVLVSKTFKSKKVPVQGDSLIAAVSVTKRVAPPKYVDEDAEWVFGKPIGVLKTDEIVKVKKLYQIPLVRDNAYAMWAEVSLMTP